MDHNRIGTQNDSIRVSSRNLIGFFLGQAQHIVLRHFTCQRCLVNRRRINCESNPQLLEQHLPSG